MTIAGGAITNDKRAVTLTADLAPLRAQCAELVELLQDLHSRDAAQRILQELLAGLDDGCKELALGGPSLALGAGEQIVEVRFVEGGLIDRSVAALRALRRIDSSGHGDLREQG
jgi:hypothetical protein